MVHSHRAATRIGLASLAIFQLLWTWNDLLLVPLVIFLAFQRYFVQGLLAGSSK